MGSSSISFTLKIWNNTEVRINNNRNYLTGYAGKTKDASGSTTETQPYNTSIGYLASTTGNITGVYDMSGCTWEYVAGYRDGSIGNSGLTLTEIRNTYSKYIDVYASNSAVTTYSKRILGDATGEMGPFHSQSSLRNNWYDDYSLFVEAIIRGFKGASIIIMKLEQVSLILADTTGERLLILLLASY